MEVASQHTTDFPNMEVKLEEEEKPYSLHQEESHTLPGSNSGFPDITVKLEEHEEEKKPRGPHQQDSEALPRTDSGFYDVTVKLEKEEQPNKLHQQEPEIFPGTGLDPVRHQSSAQMLPPTKVPLPRKRKVRFARGESAIAAIMEQQREEAEMYRRREHQRHQELLQELQVSNHIMKEESKRRAAMDKVIAQEVLVWESLLTQMRDVISVMKPNKPPLEGAASVQPRPSSLVPNGPCASQDIPGDGQSLAVP